MSVVKNLRSLVILMCLFMLGGWVMAQDTPPPAPKAAFVPYQCVFRADTNQIQILAALTGTNGLPIIDSDYQINVSVNGTGQTLQPGDIQWQSQPVRSPLQIIIVLDITDTVPIREIVESIATHLVPGLNPLDQVALITFSAQVTPITQFYTDKNRLINEHMIDLPTLTGDNRLYDAILEAVSEFPLNTDMRKIVLAITDSGRRKTEQVTSDEIIRQAILNGVQIFPIGFYSRDKPDDAELQTLANSTGGYSWIDTLIPNTRASIQSGVNNNLDNLVRTLNSEILITLNAQDLTPDASNHIPLSITINSNNDSQLAGDIVCPVKQLQHSINFVNAFDPNIPVAVVGDYPLSVNVTSDLAPDSWHVVFRVNNDPVPDVEGTSYVFKAADRYPGYYRIGAQLWDNNNKTLATTPNVVTIYAQQLLKLSINNVTSTALQGSVQFEVDLANPAITLHEAFLKVALASAPGQILDLGSAIFQADGRAILEIPDIYQKISNLFPNVTERDQILVRATIPGVSDGDKELAYSDPQSFSVVPPPPPTPVGPPSITLPTLPQFDSFTLRGVIALALLFLLNLWLRGIAKQRRVQRMINRPDKQDLSPQMMTITVRRGDITQPHTLTKKTVYIGRGSANNDINLGDDLNISREHGVVMWRKKAWYYTNRKRNTVTRINGKRYRGLRLYKMEPGAELEVGQVVMIFHSSGLQDVSDLIKTNL